MIDNTYSYIQRIQKKSLTCTAPMLLYGNITCNNNNVRYYSVRIMIPSNMNHLMYARVYIMILYSICSLHVQHNEACTYIRY